MMNLYKFKTAKTVVFTIFLLLMFAGYSFSQNIAVTDSSAYVADSSAMLDVQSSDKGMLVPRLTTSQRMAIDQPADGLLVYDKNYQTFFFYEQNGWVSVPSVSSTTSSDSALFHVTNASGDTVFAVYNDGVEITVTDTSKGKVGGFAVSGRSSGKGTKRQIMRVTPDSTVIVVNDSSAKGKVGGFAVSGRSSGKATVQDIFTANQDSTRIYVDNSNKKGKVGGFAVSGRSSGKGTSSKFLNLAPENYFIGHEAGKNITTGQFNSYFGYQTGYSNTEGNENVFLGYQSGYNNITGDANIFLGNRSGYKNDTGYWNVFIGRNTGYENTTGKQNIIIGDYAGHSNTTGEQNVFIGDIAGLSNKAGDDNVFIGASSGYMNDTGKNNVFIGSSAGYNNLDGNKNVFMGNQSGFYNSDGKWNVFIGNKSGYNNISGDENVFLGRDAGYSNTTGYANTFMGLEAGYAHTTGHHNIYIGNKAGYKNDGFYNTIIGTDAGENSTANFNTYVGKSAGRNDTVGDNTYVGHGAARYNASGNENVYLGGRAGFWQTEGSNNVIIGYKAAHLSSGNDSFGSGNVIIGHQAAENEVGISNKLFIENTNSSNPLIYGEFDNDRLTFNADVGIGTTSPVNPLHIEKTGSETFHAAIDLHSESSDTAGIILRERTSDEYGFDLYHDGAGNELVFEGIGVDGNSNGKHLIISRSSGYITMPGTYGQTVGATNRDLYIDDNGNIGYASSSARYKNNIHNMEDISWLYKLRPVNFTYKSDELNRKQYGLIAEEVEKINSSFIGYNKKGEVETVNYDQLISPLLKAVQDQKSKIDKQEDKIKQLEKDNQNLENRVDKLENELDQLKETVKNLK